MSMIIQPGRFAVAAGAGTSALWNSADKHANITLSGGDRIASNSTGAWSGVRANASRSSGKYYFEISNTTPVSADGGRLVFGVANSSWGLSGFGSVGAAHWMSDGSSMDINSAGQAVGVRINFATTAVTPRVMGFAVDFTNNKIWAKNISAGGNWNNTAGADPTTNTSGLDISGITGSPLFPAAMMYGDTIRNATLLGTFVGTVPSGFSAW